MCVLFKWEYENVVGKGGEGREGEERGGKGRERGGEGRAGEQRER